MTRAHTDIPDRDTPAALNAARHATGADTSFCDQHGRPARWPNDIDERRPATAEPITVQPGEQPS